MGAQGGVSDKSISQKGSVWPQRPPLGRGLDMIGERWMGMLKVW